MKNGGLLVKICGQTRQEDLDLCQELGADMAGFIFHRPSPRYITPCRARDLKTGSMLRVGVFTTQTAVEISGLAQKARLDLIQLHGGQSPDICRYLRPGRVIKVLWPERYKSRQELLAEAELFRNRCRYFLLDAGKSLGGHGRAMGLDMPVGLELPHPWILAGGLGPDNIRQALTACRPAGVDLNSGLESEPGCKDPNLVRQTLDAIKALRSADKRGKLNKE
jgi:phosphoribosylanthranilate isomerase